MGCAVLYGLRRPNIDTSATHNRSKQERKRKIFWVE
jgi:hypothetical protein